MKASRWQLVVFVLAAFAASSAVGLVLALGGAGHPAPHKTAGHSNKIVRTTTLPNGDILVTERPTAKAATTITRATATPAVTTTTPKASNTPAYALTVNKLPAQVRHTVTLVAHQPQYFVTVHPSLGKTVREYVNTKSGYEITYVGSRMLGVQLGADEYDYNPAHACYVQSTARNELPQLANSLVPMGMVGVSYTYSQDGTISWTAQTGDGFAPHGTITLDQSTKLVNATTTYYGRHEPPTRVTVSYTHSLPRPDAPRDLCPVIGSSN